MDTKTTVRCPKCGTSFLIPEHESHVSGVAIGKDSNLGTVFLTPDNESDKKYDHGYVHNTPKRGPDGKFLPRSVGQTELDGHRYCPRGNSSNKDCEYCDNGVCRAVCYATCPPKWDPCVYEYAKTEFDGKPDVNNEQYKLSEKIRKDGKYVKNHRLFRRWIMSQVFHMLKYEKKHGYSFTDQLRGRGLGYMWKVLENEASDIMSIHKNGDLAEVERRCLFWNDTTFNDICGNFVEQVSKRIKKAKKHKCHGREYIRIPGFGNVFCSDIDKKVTSVFKKLASNPSIHSIGRFCDFAKRFRDGRNFSLKMPVTFVNAYKGAGAYFTLRNMIMFHGCELPGEIVDKFGSGITTQTAIEKNLQVLDCVAKLYKNQGWQLLGLLRDTLEANDIDVEEKIRSWQKVQP